jgi:hypothetical protein
VAGEAVLEDQLAVVGRDDDERVVIAPGLLERPRIAPTAWSAKTISPSYCETKCSCASGVCGRVLRCERADHGAELGVLLREHGVERRRRIVGLVRVEDVHEEENTSCARGATP